MVSSLQSARSGRSLSDLVAGPERPGWMAVWIALRHEGDSHHVQHRGRVTSACWDMVASSIRVSQAAWWLHAVCHADVAAERFLGVATRVRPKNPEVPAGVDPAAGRSAQANCPVTLGSKRRVPAGYPADGVHHQHVQIV